MSVKTVNSMVSEMRVNDSFNFTYKGKKYTFKCYKENSYSVDKNSFQTMNVDKISSKYVTIYDFDMMSQRTTYKIAIDEMELIGCGDEDIASEQNIWDDIMGNNEYLTQEQYDTCFNTHPSETRLSTSLLGEDSGYGMYLNLNLYSEHDHEKY